MSYIAGYCHKTVPNQKTQQKFTAESINTKKKKKKKSRFSPIRLLTAQDIKVKNDCFDIDQLMQYGHLFRVYRIHFTYKKPVES